MVTKMVKAMTAVVVIFTCVVFLGIDEGLGIAIHHTKLDRALPVSAVINFRA